MRAITVAVSYSDLLAVTLPRNRGHFSEFMVVTAPGDDAARIAREHDCRVFETDAFWHGGAAFNKFKSLELALDAYGRHGWLALLDADVVLPSRPDLFGSPVGDFMEPGRLYGALRRMAPWPLDPIPPESEWARRYRLHSNVNEWAGFCQCLEASDPHLGPPPWHETNYLHAGTADSLFQAKWPRECKERFPWEVLHLGPAGTNWMGRASPYADGTVPPDSREKVARLRDMIRRRRPGAGRFDHEKLGGGQ